MKNLFTCTLGPVQDFIATARRSRDLWYGSWMLSELSRAAAKYVNGKFPGSLVFPRISDPNDYEPGSRLNIPNKIVAIIDGDIGTLGDDVLEAIISRLGELSEDALDRIKGRINYDLAIQQIKDLPEYYWVNVSYPDDSAYIRARNQVETLLAARKTTRDFIQAEGMNVPKSSLDGARESVIMESEYPKASDTDKSEKIRKLYHHYHARQGERLSGVDLLKRLGEPKGAPEFKSTSHMAALPFLERLGEKARELVIDVHKLFNEKNWNIGERDDGAILYESRLVDWIPAGQEQEDLRKGLAEILDLYAGDLRPSTYYALLAADGDNMGVIIDAQKTPDAHRKLSEALSGIAAEVPEIVRKHKGVPIYAGGDDVLAYLPLHTALDCASELDGLFKTSLQQYNIHKDGLNISPTLSIGIAIAHHLEPLSEVLELARDAEKAAKKVNAKNGLSIILSKRGGANRTITGKWNSLYDRLGSLVEFAKKDAISHGVAYELQELYRLLSKTEIPEAGLREEALRIVARKQESGGDKAISKEVKQFFKQWLEEKVDKITLDELAKEMIVAGMLADSTQPKEDLKEVHS